MADELKLLITSADVSSQETLYYCLPLELNLKCKMFHRHIMHAISGDGRHIPKVFIPPSWLMNHCGGGGMLFGLGGKNNKWRGE